MRSWRQLATMPLTLRVGHFKSVNLVWNPLQTCLEAFLFGYSRVCQVSNQYFLSERVRLAISIELINTTEGKVDEKRVVVTGASNERVLAQG